MSTGALYTGFLESILGALPRVPQDVKHLSCSCLSAGQCLHPHVQLQELATELAGRNRAGGRSGIKENVLLGTGPVQTLRGD